MQNICIDVNSFFLPAKLYRVFYVFYILSSYQGKDSVYEYILPCLSSTVSKVKRDRVGMTKW